MEEVENVGLPPPWLEVLLTKEFYAMCSKHTSQYKTYFCKTCMKDLVCPSCLRTSDHKDHKTLRVFRASWKPSMCAADLNNIWSVKKVQPFKINNRAVVLLHERQIKSPGGCIRCHGSLPDDEKYQFCSLECQIKSLINNGNGEPEHAENSDSPPSPVNNNGSNGSPLVKRKPDRPVEARQGDLKPHKVARASKPGPSKVQEQLNVAVDEAAGVRRHRRKGIPRRAHEISGCNSCCYTYCN